MNRYRPFLIASFLLALAVAGLWKWDHRGVSFVFDRQWGLGGDRSGWFDLPHDVAVDREGLVYVADFHNERIQQFDAQGNFVGIVASYGSGLGEVKYPRSLTLDPQGNLYVFEQGNEGRIQKFDRSGKGGIFFSKKELGPKAFQGGADLTVAENGKVYVAEPRSNQVEVFTLDGHFLKAWGGPGEGDGKFDGLFGITADGAGHLYCSDVNHDRIEKFDLEGNFLLAFGKPGKGPGELDHPNKLACDRLHRLFVADSWNHRIQVFDPQGRSLAVFGAKGHGEGQLDTPYGVEVDPQGRVYVADTGNNRIVVFKPR
jgi:DNA-binding beta-propeller fold protein YncE